MTKEQFENARLIVDEISYFSEFVNKNKATIAGSDESRFWEVLRCCCASMPATRIEELAKEALACAEAKLQNKEAELAAL